MPGRVAATYLIAGLLWIALSDRAVELIFASQPALGAEVQTWKGVAYVLITAVLLFWSLRGWAARHAAAVERHDLAARRAQELFELAPIPMWVCNDEGVLLDVNEAACRVLGYTAPELRGTDSDRLRDPTESARVRSLKGNLPTGAPPWSIGMIRHLTRDGRTVLADVFVSPVSWEGGRANLVALHDITELRAAERRLRETESTFQELLGAMNEVVWIADAGTMQVMYVSPAVERLIGRAPAELVGQRLGEMGVVHPEDAERVGRVLTEARSGDTFGERVRVVHADGSLVWVDYSGVMVRGADGAPHRLVGIVADVTEARAAEAELRLADRVFHHAREGIVITDPETRILRVNPSFTHITGYAPEEIVGRTPKVLSSGQHPPAFYADMWAAIRSSGHWQGEVWNRTRSGEVYLEWLSVTAIRDEEGRVAHYMGVFTDITTARRSELRIHQLVNYDATTGLPNRQLFEERVSACCVDELDGDCGCAVILLGLDRFRGINETLGRHVGDAILSELAERLRATLENGDGLARLQGDVFAAHVSDAGAVRRVADRLLAAVSRPFDGPDGDMHLTASAGVARFPEHGTTAADLLRHAEVAMFQAKRVGRGTVVEFEAELERVVSERLGLELRLRRAVDLGQLQLHYQPQVQLRTHHCVAVEALLRWPTPTGMISPALFIPVAEETGLIFDIGRWVLTEACRAARAWAEGPNGPLVVAVNISAHQFRQDDFVSIVAQTLADTGLPANLLELEVTEGVVMDGAERVQHTLQELRRLGVRLSIDDFGTGYSSLAYLRRFAIDKLKIDQSFVREMLRDPDAAAVTHAIVELAKSLRLGVIAEGVETEEQAAFLTTVGCDEAQGWLYAKAMPSEDLEAWRRSFPLHRVISA